MLVNLVSADSERRFVAEVQQAIDEEWDPVWESFRMVTVNDEGHHKMIFAIMMRKNGNSENTVSEKSANHVEL